MYIKAWVTPGVKKEVFKQEGSDQFTISIKQKAERNMANNRVRELLAKHYNLQIGKVRIISGHRSPSKMFSIDIL